MHVFASWLQLHDVTEMHFKMKLHWPDATPGSH